MAPLRSLGNINSAFDDFYARTGKEAAGPNIPPPAPISASGGTKTTSGVYTIHTFTSSGSLVVSSTAVGLPNAIEYLVVAGGGGGGCHSAGGGGGGGYRSSVGSESSGGGGSTESTITAAVKTYPVTMGAGGAA